MTPLPIRIYGDPALRRKSEPVREITPEVRKLAEDMIKTMYDAPGIGLAAAQVGVFKRLFVIDPAFGEEKGTAFALINPVVRPVDRNEQVLIEEGCLSVPEVRADVLRPARITVEYRNLAGETIRLEAEELLARVIQHENDHLDGILFVDRLTPVKRQLLGKQLRAMARSQQRRKVQAVA